MVLNFVSVFLSFISLLLMLIHFRYNHVTMWWIREFACSLASLLAHCHCVNKFPFKPQTLFLGVFHCFPMKFHHFFVLRLLNGHNKVARTCANTSTFSFSALVQWTWEIWECWTYYRCYYRRTVVDLILVSVDPSQGWLSN